MMQWLWSERKNGISNVYKAFAWETGRKRHLVAQDQEQGGKEGSKASFKYGKFEP